MIVVKWKDEFFLSNQRRGAQILIGTWFLDKGKRYGFQWGGGLTRYVKWVDESEISVQQKFTDRFRVKFKDHFYRICGTKEDGGIELLTLRISHELAHELGFNLSYNELPWLWVMEDDVIHTSDVVDRIAYFDGDDFSKSRFNSGVYFVLEENDTHFLLEEDSYLSSDEWTPERLWIPKNDVFLYNEPNEPIIL